MKQIYRIVALALCLLTLSALLCACWDQNEAEQTTQTSDTTIHTEAILTTDGSTTEIPKDTSETESTREYSNRY